MSRSHEQNRKGKGHLKKPPIDKRHKAQNPSADTLHSYRETPHGLGFESEGKVTPLTTFKARIIKDILQDDDSGELVRVFEIAASTASRSSTFRVTVNEFKRMQWPMEKLGPEAVVHAGIINADRASVAIQLLSGTVPLQIEFRHTGWRKIGAKWYYLHAGTALGRVPWSENGSISPNPTGNPTTSPNGNVSPDQNLATTGRVGQVADVIVKLDSGLEHVCLPALESSDDLRVFIREALLFLKLGPLQVTAPIFCAVWRSVLGPADFGIHVCGPSGCFKTEMTAIAQQFFGPQLHARNLIGSWSSTSNSLCALLHAAKDMAIVLDDYAPQGAMNETKLQAAAEQVFRAQGNGAGRGRARPDGTLRPTLRPRGTPISTGEDVPIGYSLQARLLIPFVEPDSIDKAILTQLQAVGRNGNLAKVMRAFTDSLADDIERHRTDIPKLVHNHREQLGDLRGHARQADTVAHLLVGLDHFLAFAENAGAITQKESELLWAEVTEALRSVAKKQRNDLWSADPVERFRALLRSALVGGHAHFCSHSGAEPHQSLLYGWKFFPGVDNEGVSRPQGECIGWVEGWDIYLDPDTSYRVARRVIGSGGEPLTATSRVLRKRMLKHLKTHELDTRETYTVRRTLQGVRREVLHVDFTFIFGDYDPPSEQNFLALLDV